MKLNSTQHKLFSDWLNYLSIAWITTGVITTLFNQSTNFAESAIKIAAALAIGVVFFFLAIYNIRNKKKL